jgi:hypothetical protein
VNRRGIHPGAHIALDFCIATGFFTAGTFDIIFFVTLEIAAGSLEILAGYVEFLRLGWVRFDLMFPRIG